MTDQAGTSSIAIETEAGLNYYTSAARQNDEGNSLPPDVIDLLETNEAMIVQQSLYLQDLMDMGEEQENIIIELQTQLARNVSKNRKKITIKSKALTIAHRETQKNIVRRLKRYAMVLND